MTHLCCHQCQLRFTPTAEAYLAACPECGGPPQPIVDLERALGFRLVGPEDPLHELPRAVAVSLLRPDSRGARS